MATPKPSSFCLAPAVDTTGRLGTRLIRCSEARDLRAVLTRDLPAPAQYDSNEGACCSPVRHRRVRRGAIAACRQLRRRADTSCCRWCKEGACLATATSSGRKSDGGASRGRRASSELLVAVVYLRVHGAERAVVARDCFRMKTCPRRCR